MNRTTRKKWVAEADKLARMDGQIEACLVAFPGSYSLENAGFSEHAIDNMIRARADLRCAQDAVRYARKHLLHDLQEGPNAQAT